MRRNEMQDLAVPAKDIAKLGVADAGGILQHGCKHRLKIAGELLITWSTSDVAVCCSSASFSSRVSRATSVSWLAGEELRRDAAFSASRGFSFAALRRRVLAGLPPALERRLTASPLGSGRGIVGGQTSTPEGAACEFRHRSLSSRLMSLLGHLRRGQVEAISAIAPSLPNRCIRTTD